VYPGIELDPGLGHGTNVCQFCCFHLWPAYYLRITAVERRGRRQSAGPQAMGTLANHLATDQTWRAQAVRGGDHSAAR
jgi:hypothetical protein